MARVIQASYTYGMRPVDNGGILERFGANGSFAAAPQRAGLTAEGGPVGNGVALPASVRVHMESTLGGDFSQVRVHSGPQAGMLGAVAFATGDHIFFAPGQYRPDAIQGQQLIGHELAHVLQQRQGRVPVPGGGGVVVVQDVDLEAEAARLGSRAALLGTVREAEASSGGTPSAAGGDPVRPINTPQP
jgi:hypothetical protein